MKPFPFLIAALALTLNAQDAKPAADLKPTLEVGKAAAAAAAAAPNGAAASTPKSARIAGIFDSSRAYSTAVLSPYNDSNDAPFFINKYFKSFDNFKDAFQKEAMKIQGSGWVYLSTDGSIKTIKNHQIKMDIVFIVDWWEHAWALDYQSDKKGYLANQWKIINWNIVSSRIGLRS